MRGGIINYYLKDDLHKNLAGSIYQFRPNYQNNTGQIVWSCYTTLGKGIDIFNCSEYKGKFPPFDKDIVGDRGQTGCSIFSQMLFPWNGIQLVLHSDCEVINGQLKIHLLGNWSDFDENGKVSNVYKNKPVPVSVTELYHDYDTGYTYSLVEDGKDGLKSLVAHRVGLDGKVSDTLTLNTPDGKRFSISSEVSDIVLGRPGNCSDCELKPYPGLGLSGLFVFEASENKESVLEKFNTENSPIIENNYNNRMNDLREKGFYNTGNSIIEEVDIAKKSYEKMIELFYEYMSN